MKMAMMIVIVATPVVACQQCRKLDPPKLANSIYVVEGGARASSPYGIKSVRVKDHADARKVCINTIRNNYARWTASGGKGCYLDFLADRYCPPTADRVGNRNWKKNIHKMEG